MRKIETLDSYEESYFREHPEEIDGYITLIFDEYAKDSDMGALLSSLRVICRVLGITATAKAAGMTRNGLQKILTTRGNPRFSNITLIMHAMGYKLTPQKISR